MAGINVSGTVCKTKDGDALTVVNFTKKDGSADTLVTFNIADAEYVYSKQGEKAPGQYYRCQLRGMQAQIATERIKAGMFVAARGQLVQREWNGGRQYTIDNAVVSYPAKGDSAEGNSKKTKFDGDDIPF